MNDLIAFTIELIYKSFWYNLLFIQINDSFLKYTISPELIIRNIYC
jgi:hypothetical protein